MTSLGVIFRPEVAPERLLDVARVADESGLEQLWLWEDCFYAGGIASAGAVLGATTRLQVGIGVLPVPLRNVALAAMEVAGLSRLFPDRLRPGFGHGVLEWMGQVGNRAESPMTLLREYLDALQALLAGETVTRQGRYVNLDDVRLAWVATPAPAIHVAAIGPRTVALSAELGDGTVLPNQTTTAQVRAARELVDRTRAQTGRGGHQHITVYLSATTGPGAAERLEAENRRWELGPDDGTGVAGGADEVAAAVRELAQAGADSVILQPAAGDPDLIGFVEFAAEQVAPLVQG